VPALGPRLGASLLLLLLKLLVDVLQSSADPVKVAPDSGKPLLLAGHSNTSINTAQRFDNIRTAPLSPLTV
jgi:hypothetical protein